MMTEQEKSYEDLRYELDHLVDDPPDHWIVGGHDYQIDVVIRRLLREIDKRVAAIKRLLADQASAATTIHTQIAETNEFKAKLTERDAEIEKLKGEIVLYKENVFGNEECIDNLHLEIAKLQAFVTNHTGCDPDGT